MQDFYVEKRTENGIEDGYVAVSVSQINLLAQFAVTLNVPENILAETEIGMYMANLSEFYLKNDKQNNRFLELIKDIPVNVLNVTDEIIDFARKGLDKELDDFLKELLEK